MVFLVGMVIQWPWHPRPGKCCLDNTFIHLCVYSDAIHDNFLWLRTGVWPIGCTATPLTYTNHVEIRAWSPCARSRLCGVRGHFSRTCRVLWLIVIYLFVQFEWETKRRLNIKCGKLRIPFGPLGATSDKTNRPIVEVEVVIGCNNGFLQSRDSCAWVV